MVDQLGAQWLSDLAQDVRHGSRSLRRTPIFTVVALVTLACAVGANTAIFSLLHVLVLRDLPVRAPADLVQFLWTYPGDPPLNFFRVPDYENYRDHNRVFSEMFGTTSVRVEARTDGAGAEVGVECVTENFFTALGVRSAAGRLLVAGDSQPGSPAVAVVSSTYWNERFNGSPRIIGSSMTLLGDLPVTVVGVAEPGFFGLAVAYRPDVWIPASVCQRKGPIGLAVMARLKDGVTIERAQAEMRVMDRTRIEDFARRDPKWRETTLEVLPARAGFSTPLHQQFVSPLWVLMGLVGVLLLLACANIGSLFLARGAARQREMAVRVSLGAGRWRIVRQLLTESLLLAVGGAFLGTIAAYIGARGLLHIMASGTRMIGVPPRLEITLDAPVLMFTVAIMALAVLLFGLVPAWTAFVSRPAQAMRDGRGAGQSKSRKTFGNGLVVAQVALSVVLVAVAALNVGYLSTLLDTRSLGFDPRSVLLVTLDARASDQSRGAVTSRYKELLDRLQSMPGVRSATLSGMTPISGAAGSRFVTVDGFSEAPQVRRRVALNTVAPGYFETLRTSLISGRDFQRADEGRARVAIINQATVRYYFRGRNPLGAHLQFDGDREPYEIVGVVADAKYADVRTPAPRTIYLHQFQQSRSTTTELSLRTAGTATALADDVRRLVPEVMGGARVTRMTTLAEQVDGSIVPERLVASLASFFGGAGMLLAGVGLYGLLAFTVARRTHDIGVRMALGAQRRDVMNLVLRSALTLVGIGLVIGVPVALWSTRLASSMIGQMPVRTPTSLVVAVFATIAVGLLAAFVPARRATRIDPLLAMRAE